MTISTSDNRISYDGTGALTPLSYPYPFFDADDLVVVETIIATGVQTIIPITTRYTVSGTPDDLGHYINGGTITPVTIFAVTVRWTIYNDPSITQEQLDLVENDNLPAESVEAAFDYLTMLQQRASDRINRTLQQPEGDEDDIGRLPSKVDRLGTYLGFDETTGDPVALAAPTDTTAVSAFAATLLDDTDAATARATLGITVTTNKDDEFRVTGSSDTTKKLAFEVDANVSTATTRTVTVQNLDGTMALLGTVAGYAGTATVAVGVGFGHLTGASFTLTLPQAADYVGPPIRLQHRGTSLTQVYTIKANGAEDIIAPDGTANTFILYTNGEEITLISNGTSWFVTGHVAETDWVDAGAMTIEAVTSNPTKPTTPDYDKVFWKRKGKEVRVKWLLQISSAAGAADGTGAYLFRTPTGVAIETNDSVGLLGTAWATATMSETIRGCVGGSGKIVVDSTNRDTVMPVAYSADGTQLMMVRHSSDTPVGSAAFAMSTAEMGYYLEAVFQARNWRV